MKAMTKTPIRTVLMGLGFVVVLAVPGWAQFEINPDHYESRTAVAAPQPRMAVSVQSKEAAAPAILRLRKGQRPAELRLAATSDRSRAVQQQGRVELREGGLAAALRRAARYLGQELSRWAARAGEIDCESLNCVDAG